MTQTNGQTDRQLADFAAREALASSRDRAGSRRDYEAALRDRLAEAADAQISELALSDGLATDMPASRDALVVRVARDRERAAADRAGAAEQRAAAARDREQAAIDRQLAAADREQAAAELAAAGVDDLTGALRRGVGLTAVEREIARARRTEQPLVLAFVDVDGLKLVNDSQGHLAGDRLLQRVADAISTHLRPYDITVRIGGDEFLCSLQGVTTDDVRERLGQVAAALAADRAGGSISFGLADLHPEDSLDDLIGRADAALLAARGADGSRSRSLRRLGR